VDKICEFRAGKVGARVCLIVAVSDRAWISLLGSSPVDIVGARNPKTMPTHVYGSTSLGEWMEREPTE